MKRKLRILFACVENSFRSQMAEAIANYFFSDKIKAESAGSSPAGKVHPNTIKILDEIGIDTSNLYSKGFKDLKKPQYDYIITMGCKDKCPFYPAKAALEWEFPDIKTGPIEKIRKLRTDIKNKIKELVSAD